MPAAPLDEQAQAIYDHLKKVRASTTVSLKPTPLLRKEIIGFDGQPQPFNLRYYQVQGLYHLLTCRRMVLGDGTGLGKTCQQIGALCYLWAKEPDLKPIVVAPKSALKQWEAEIYKFTHEIKAFVATGSFAQRKKAYEEWAKTPKSVLITNYHGIVRDWEAGAAESAIAVERGKTKSISQGYVATLTSGMRLCLILDEVTACKNPATKTHQVCRQVSERSERCYGLTATLLKNNLIEGFGIYQVVKPGLFGSRSRFMTDYCVVEMQKVRGGAKVPIIVGYKNLADFRSVIDPYFYGRPKHLVSKELPALTTREILCELSAAEDRKYGEALSGVLELGDGDTREYEETKALTSLIYCQEIVNSLSLLHFKEGDTVMGKSADLEVSELSAKEQALIDLLEEDLEGEKVIVYSRFESMVTRLTEVLAKRKIKSVRITGKENATKRKAAQDKFQDLKSDVGVVFITDAGSEAINLQAAGAIIFYDSPWSWGNYVQLLGRMIRIGSPHQAVYAIHLVAERPAKDAKKRETIDHAIIRALRKKKGLIDQIIGEAAVGALTFQRGEASMRDLLHDIKSSAKG